jgi:hypothetical protein
MRVSTFLTAITGLVGLILVSTETLAQNDEQAPVASPTRYEVELIIFRHLDQSRNTAEIPAAASMIQDSPFDLNLAEARVTGDTGAERQTGTTTSEDELANDVGSQPPPLRSKQVVSFFLMSPRAEFPDFVPADEGSFTLNGAYKRIIRLDAYEPLMHLGWVQPARSTEAAKPYQITTQSGSPVELTGTVTLYKERYLHLALDLALESTSGDEVSEPAADIPAERVFGLNTPVNEDKPTEHVSATHKLQQSRRIRLSTTHYFDHPMFGVIATVNRIEPAASSPNNAQPGAG